MESLGSLLDKLSITNIKEWFQEDIKRDPNATDKQVADACRKTNVLNQQRHRLIEEIDKLFKDVVEGRVEPPELHEGSTKNYGPKKSAPPQPDPPPPTFQKLESPPFQGDGRLDLDGDS
jgi:hypothetical protein